MTGTRNFDAAALPSTVVSNQSPLWWGQLMMCFIEASMFLMLIAIYFYLRLSVDVWPPPGTQLPHLPWASAALVLLLLSAVPSYWASEAAEKNDVAGMLRNMILNVVLGFAFLAMRWMEVRKLNFTWATDAHGSIFWSILFLHSLDAVGDLVYTIVLIAIVARGRIGKRQVVGVHADSVVWYFIVAIWIPLYAVIYLGPHLVGAPK